MTIFSEQIAQAIQMDDNFFMNENPKAVQTDTKSVRKQQTVRNVRGHAKGLTKYVHYVH